METPTTLDGRYRLESLVGSGGAAEVWRATDLSTGEVVAVKQLMSACDDEGARLRREARLLERLSHPGIARLRATGVVDGRPHLVLDLIPGRTLADQLVLHGPMAVGEVEELAAEIGGALAYAHEQGVIHRDVKPGNVMVTPEGRAVLVDFGVGRMVGASCAVTQVGKVTGTIAYLSPEQAAGAGVTAATDIYSLGLVLAEVATGRRVFEGTPTEVSAVRMAGDAPLPAEVPPELRSLIGPMTRLDPARRPSAARVATVVAGDPSAPPTTVQHATVTAELAMVDRPEPATVGAPNRSAGAGASSLVGGFHRWRQVARGRLTGTGDEAGRIDEHTSGVHLAAAAVMGVVLAMGTVLGGASSSSGESVGTPQPPTSMTPAPTTTVAHPDEGDEDEADDEDDEVEKADEKEDDESRRGQGKARGHD